MQCEVYGSHCYYNLNTYFSMTDTISIINNDGSLEKISLCLQQESIPTFWIKCINLEALFKLILCFKILI